MIKPDYTKPTSIKLKELIEPLREEATKKDWSLNKLIRKIIASHYEKSKIPPQRVGEPTIITQRIS